MKIDELTLCHKWNKKKSTQLLWAETNEAIYVNSYTTWVGGKTVFIKGYLVLRFFHVRVRTEKLKSFQIVLLYKKRQSSFILVSYWLKEDYVIVTKFNRWPREVCEGIKRPKVMKIGSHVLLLFSCFHFVFFLINICNKNCFCLV